MSEEKTSAKIEAAKKRNIVEIPLPIQKIGAMDSLPVILGMVPFVIWTAFRYYKGGFPIGQIGLYILFLAVFVVGHHFLFSFYAFYDKDLKMIGTSQYLLGMVDDKLPVSKITGVQVHTVEIKEKKISVDILPRFAKGVYKVYRFDGDKVQIPELGEEKHEVSLTVWLYRKNDIEKFESILHEAFAECNNNTEIRRFDDIMDWTDYQKMFKAESETETKQG